MSDEKTRWPFGGFFLKLSDEKNGTHEYEDYLKECEGEKQVPEEELEFHYSKDPKKMTMQESLDEMGRLLRWNRMSPEERRAEMETQKVATRATEQAARDMPMEPESAPDIPQGAVLDEVLDNPPGVDSVLDGVSGDTPERVMDTAPDSVPDDGPDITEEAVPEAAEGNVPDEIGTLTALETLMQQEVETTRQAAEEAPEMEVTAAKEMSIPQGEGVLVLPAETTVIPEVASEPKRIRITELVKENFENWRTGTRIIFDAGVNSGKTYFILNILLPWAYQKHWKILYLCNRVPLRNEIQREVERLGRTEEKVGHWDHDLRQIVYESRVENKYKDTIRVETYQWMEAFYRANPEGAMDYLKSFRYIVADEYHYLLTDATINKYIDFSYVTLNELTKYRPVIFMSATAHPFFHRWRYETNEVLPENYYHIPSDYSYVERAVFYWTDAEEIRIIRQEARRGKVLIFVDQIAHMNKLVRELEDEFAGEIATACSPYRPEAKDCDGLEEVLQDEKLCKRITIVTTVFYNGVNIKDPELTCIISRLWDPIVNAQILGRKRPVSKQDTCAVYFKGYSHDRIKQEREHIRKRQLEPAKKWKDGKSDPEVWQTYLHKPGTVKMLDKYSRTVDRDEYGNGWVWKRRAEHQYLVQMDALKQMMEKGYQWGMLYAVTESDALLSKIEPLRFKELEDYIEEHLDEEIPWEIMRKELVERGCITNPNDRHKNQNMPVLRVINSRLKDYNAFVESVQKWIGTTERVRFWILHRLHT